MNKAQLQDDLIDCNAENLKLRELLKEGIKIANRYFDEEGDIQSLEWMEKCEGVLK